jgi:hypothetical protein
MWPWRFIEKIGRFKFEEGFINSEIEKFDSTVGQSEIEIEFIGLRKVEN